MKVLKGVNRSFSSSEGRRAAEMVVLLSHEDHPRRGWSKTAVYRNEPTIQAIRAKANGLTHAKGKKTKKASGHNKSQYLSN